MLRRFAPALLASLALALSAPPASAAGKGKKGTSAAKKGDAKKDDKADAAKGDSAKAAGDKDAAKADAQSGAKKDAKKDEGSSKDDGKAAQAAPAPQACSPQAQQAQSEKKDVAPADPSKKAGLEVYGKTPEEAAELKDLTQTIKDYEEQAKEYRKEVQLLIEKKYRDKRDQLSNSYEKAISDLEVVQRQERLDAIAQFEEFLSRYPDEARYTPDVMYRLAELYYEKGEDDLSVATKEYEAQLKLVEAGKLPTAPPEPQVNFDKPVALYQKLISQFPDYRYNDGSYYLLGYCLEKQGGFEQALSSYNTLITKYPGSKFVPEAWVRIGEYYFDQNANDALKKAIEAYTKAVAFKDHPLFDKALYKLGWAYYRIDDFDNAVTTFVALLDYYQTKAGASGEDVGGDLRNEALQYTAISFADEKWGSIDKAKAWFERIGPRAYESEIFHRLGDVNFDQGQVKDNDAVAAYRMFLALAPQDKSAPQVQGRIVEIYERAREFDKASAERELLVQNYGPTTKWAEANKHDPDVIKAAQELSERSLYSSAIFHHQQALAYKTGGKADLAFKEFQAGAKGYAAYLERFPHSKDAYELRFYLAECLYNSFEFKQASEQYILVRDSNADTKHTQDAAEAAVISLQHEIEVEQKGGKLETRPLLTSAQRKDGEKIESVDLPQPIKDYIGAVDGYLLMFPKCERAPAFAYNAAVHYYSYNQFEEARKRFEGIISNYPENMVAKLATNLIVETYLTTKDWKKVEETAGNLSKDACKADAKSDACITLTKFKLAGVFKGADALMAQDKYGEAAAKYIQLVDEVQAQAKAGNDDSIREAKDFCDKALNNAAVCLEKDHRFDSALKIYERLYTQYPTSTLADTALFRVAVNAEQSYDFDRAISGYTNLVKNYPQSKNRAAAMANQARLLEGDQRYKEAAKAYSAYAETFSDQDDAPTFQYKSALIYDRMKDYKGEIAALQEFQRKFKGTSKGTVPELIVEAHKRIGDAYGHLGQDKAAKGAYEDCVAEYKRRGLKPEANIASNAAAESSFQLAEYEFAAFDKMKIGGRGKALENSVKAKAAALKKAADAYALIVPYKRVEWTLASFYRRGYLLERLGAAFTEAPIPPDVKRLGDEAVATYQDLLGQQAAQYEDKAVEAYVATLNQAKTLHVLNNIWIAKTLESLNRFRPKEYPLLKEPKSALAFDALYPTRLADTPAGPTEITPAPEQQPAPSPAPESKPEVTPSSAQPKGAQQSGAQPTNKVSGNEK